MRSFVIAPPNQADYDTLNDSFTESDYDYSDNVDFYYIVDDVILNTSKKEFTVKSYDAGYNPDTQMYSGSTPFPDEGEIGVVYVDDYIDQDILEEKRAELIEKGLSPNLYQPPLSIYIWSKTEHRYVEPETELDSIHVRECGTYDMASIDIKKFNYITNIKETSNVIEWAYGEGTTPEDIDKIELHLSGFTDAIVIDPQNLSYTLTELSPNSHYQGYMIFYGKNGSSKRFIINFITLKSKEDDNSPLNSLIGLTW